MIQNDLHSSRDAAIERRIDGLFVNAAHRESASVHYRHATETIDNTYRIVETLQRFAETVCRALLHRGVGQTRPHRFGARR